MNKIVLVFLSFFLLMGCNSQEEKNAMIIERQKEEIATLEREIEELQLEKEALIKEVEYRKVTSGTAKYVITLEIKQRHYFDLGKALKDELNKIELQLPVDKEYYESLEVGDILDETFRMGSLLMEGSFGNWEIKVVKKEIQ